MTTELKAVTDITISDRLSTQLQYEVKIKELIEKLQKVEAELVKHRSIFYINVDPNNGKATISVELNNKVKKVEFFPHEVDDYLKSSDPVGAILNDIFDIVSQPYREVVNDTFRESIQAIVNNRKSLNGKTL